MPPYVLKQPSVTLRTNYTLKCIPIIEVKMKVLSHVCKLESTSAAPYLQEEGSEHEPLVMLLLGASTEMSVDSASDEI